MKKTGLRPWLFPTLILALLTAAGCKQDEWVDIQLKTSKTFDDHQGNGETVTWSCLYEAGTDVWCLYYYDGKLQRKGTMSAAARLQAPGLSAKYHYLEEYAMLRNRNPGHYKTVSLHRNNQWGSKTILTLPLTLNIDSAPYWDGIMDKVGNHRTWEVTFYPGEAPGMHSIPNQ